MRYFHVRKLRAGSPHKPMTRVYVFDADSDEEYQAAIAVIDGDPETLPPVGEDAGDELNGTPRNG
jgi:hypothetical protein